MLQEVVLARELASHWRENWNLIITRPDQVSKISGEPEHQLSQAKEKAHEIRRADDELCDRLEASQVESHQKTESSKQELAETKEKLQVSARLNRQLSQRASAATTSKSWDPTSWSSRTGTTSSFTQRRSCSEPLEGSS